MVQILLVEMKSILLTDIINDFIDKTASLLIQNEYIGYVALIL